MASVSIDLSGRSALVTGGSRGIGRACVERLASAGARVVTASRGDAGEAVAASLRESGHDVVHVPCDVSDASALKALVMATRKRFGSLDCVVNNAAIMELGVVGMSSTDSIERQFAVNITSVINLTQLVVRLMPAKGGSIVNIASIAGTRGIPGVSVYSATKGAVVSYTMAAAKELAPRNIRVNAVAPGFIDTDMIKSLSDDWIQRRVEGIAMKRSGKPEEVADAVLFLCSDLATYVTGQVLGVDGGMVV